MPGLNGIDGARMILEQAPKTKIVFVTMHANRVIMKEAFRAGASAFVVKNCAASDLVLAVRTVLAGGTYVSPEVQETLDSKLPKELSERQIEVLRLIAQGCSAKQIAFQTEHLGAHSGVPQECHYGETHAPHHCGAHALVRSSTASGLRALARRAVIVIGTVDALTASDNTSHCFERWWLGKPIGRVRQVASGKIVSPSIRPAPIWFAHLTERAPAPTR